MLSRKTNKKRYKKDNCTQTHKPHFQIPTSSHIHTRNHTCSHRQALLCPKPGRVLLRKPAAQTPKRHCFNLCFLMSCLRHLRKRKKFSSKAPLVSRRKHSRSLLSRTFQLFTTMQSHSGINSLSCTRALQVVQALVVGATGLDCSPCRVRRLVLDSLGQVHGMQ